MTESLPISWSHDERRLEQSRNYWLATVRSDGRPHVAPVWGVWLDCRFHFATGRSTIKGQNLRANPQAALHLDDSEDVLVMEGFVEAVDDASLRRRIDHAFSTKYVTITAGEPYTLAMNPEAELWTLTPSHAVGWWEMAMTATSRRWTWLDGGQPTPSPGWQPSRR